MRVKSIKIKDDSLYKNYKLPENPLNDSKDRLFVRNKAKSPIEQFLETYDLSSKLEKEKLIILKQFHKNTLENAKRLSFLNESFKNKVKRSKSNMQASIDDTVKNIANKTVLESSRPKTTAIIKPKRLSFNEIIDGNRIEIKAAQAPLNTIKMNETILENPEIIKIDELKELYPPNTAASKANTDTFSDVLTLKSSVNFPSLKSAANTSTILSNSPVSSRPDRSAKYRTEKRTKQLLKTKSAKLLFYDSNNISSSNNNGLNQYVQAETISLNSNDFARWDEKTTKKHENRKKRILYKREKDFKGYMNNSTIHFDPPTSPTSQFYDNNEPVKSKSVRPINTSRSRDTGHSTQSSSFIINKISKSDENRMNIKDLIKYMKPIDNQSLESKPVESLGPVMQVNNGNRKKYKANIPIASTFTNIPNSNNTFTNNYANSTKTPFNTFINITTVNNNNSNHNLTSSTTPSATKTTSYNSTNNTSNNANTNNVSIIASNKKHIVNIEETNTSGKLMRNNNSKTIANKSIILNNENLVKPISKIVKLEEIKPERFELNIKIPLDHNDQYLYQEN